MENIKLNQSKIDNRIKYLELILKDYEVKAPFKGIMLKKLVENGENIIPGTPLFEIFNPNSIFIDIFLEQEEISLLKIGQKCKIEIDGLTNKNLYGVISYFGSKAKFSPRYIVSEKERKSLLYRVKVKIKENYELFKLGMPVTVEIDKK